MKQGWEIKKLGETVDVLDNLRKPITKRDRIEGEYPYYGATGILSYVHNYIFSEKLVLIGEDGAKWLSGDNTSFIADGKYWVNNHAHVIRPKRKIILDEWIVYFLNFSDLTPFITGMTVPKLNQEKMRSIPIPLPPLPTQQRIVAILDEAFAAIAKAKANAQQNLQNAKELFESYLQGVFENKGEGWEENTLGEMIEIKNGKNQLAVLSATGQYKVMGSAGNVMGYAVDFICEAGTTIIGRKGNISKPIYIEERFWNVDTAFGFFPKNQNDIDKRFVYYLCLGIDFKSMNRGTTIPSLVKSELQTIQIAFPKSLKTQQAIVQKLDALNAETKKLESIYQQKINNLEELKKSVLQKAFAGELKTETEVV